MSDLTGQPKLTSIVLTWTAPQEPNGVIISYEVTYRVSDGNLVTTNTTDLRFTIPSLTPGTNVTEISVSAYTSVGRGDPAMIPYLTTLTAPRKSKTLFSKSLGPSSLSEPQTREFGAEISVRLLACLYVRIRWTSCAKLLLKCSRTRVITTCTCTVVSQLYYTTAMES